MNEQGEIIAELNEGDNVVPKKVTDYLATQQQYRVYKPNGWQSIYTNNLDFALKSLSPSQVKVLNYIMQNVRKYTQKIAYKNGRAITADNLAANIKIAHRSAQTALNALQEKGIIKYIEKHKAYLFNPYILFKGRYTDKEVMEMFADTEFASRKDNN